MKILHSNTKQNKKNIAQQQNRSKGKVAQQKHRRKEIISH
jgi:hypothetical protein